MNRRGMMLLEVIVAGSLLAVLMAICVQLLSAAADQRHAADQRQCAIEELANLMERIAARPWADLTEAVATQEQETLSASAESQLPGAELKIEIVAEPEEPDAKRITASLRWQNRNGQYVAPLSLTTWRYGIAEMMNDE